MTRLVINPEDALLDTESEEAKEERDNARLVARVKARFAHRLEDKATALSCSGCGHSLDATTDPRWECGECDAECVLCPECYTAEPALRHTHGGTAFWHLETQQRWALKRRLFQRAYGLSCRQFLAETFAAFSERPFLGQWRGDEGTAAWQWWSFRDAARESHMVCCALSEAFGLRPGQRVALLCENSVQWALVDFACILGLFVLVPIHVSSPPEHITAILASADVVAAVVSSSCTARFFAALQKLQHPTVRNAVIVRLVTNAASAPLQSSSPKCDPHDIPAWCQVHEWEEFVRLGALAAPPTSGYPSRVAERLGTRDSLVTIVFTSGSGGKPKGVQFTDGDWLEQLVFPLTLKHVVLFGYMPLSHLAGRVDLYTALSNGGRIAFPCPVRQQLEVGLGFFDELRQIRPTAFGPVPRICNAVKEAYERDLALLRLQQPEAPIQQLKKIARKRFRNVFGDRLSSVKITSAPVTAKMRRFLRKILKIAVNEGYGSSEAGSIALNGRLATPIMLESVPDLGYRVTDTPPRGFIYVPRQSLRCSSLLAGGDLGEWFCTGDIGEYRNGRLRVIDRQDGVVKLSGGEFLELGRLERIFSSQDRALVRHAFVYADGFKDAAVLLVVPASPNVGRKEIETMVRKAAAEHSLAPHEIPCGVQVLSSEAETGWTAAQGLVSDLGKPIRRALIERYCSVIDATYAAAALARALPDCGNVDWSRTFTELGGDSLAASKVLSDLRAQNIVVPPFDALVRTPLQSLATCTQSGGKVDSTTDEVVLPDEVAWFKRELSLLFGMEKRSPAQMPPVSTTQKIFLTGATGFLGRRLLKELLIQHPHAVYYLLCRKPPSLLPPFSDPRVVIVRGDLSLPLFGLSQQSFAELCAQRFDCVVHCAACVNHLVSFSDLRATNVCSLRDAAAVAICNGSHRPAPLHVITSSAVYQAKHFHSTGYATSKFVQDSLACEAEAIAASAAGATWPVFVYRPALIGPDSETGETNKRDWLHRLISAVLGMRVVPLLEETRLNWVAVDYAARIIATQTVLSAVRPASCGRVIDICGTNAGLDTFMGAVRRLEGVAAVPYAVWHEMLAKAVVARPDCRPAAPFVAQWAEGLPGITLCDVAAAEEHVRRRQHAQSITSCNDLLPFVAASPPTIELAIQHVIASI